MAAKKGGQIPFQTEVTTEDEWNKLLEKIGVVVVDVYSDWCGPCIAMISNLKKLKLEIGSDFLHFAVIWRVKCDPTSKFHSLAVKHLEFEQIVPQKHKTTIWSGNLVNLMFGVNAPQLISLIKNELEIELEVLDGKRERKSIPFNQKTEIELQREAITSYKEKEQEMIEQQILEKKLKIIKKRSLEKLSKLLYNYTCIVYFPHMISDNTCIVAKKMMYLYDSLSISVIDQINIQMDQFILDQVSYNCKIFQNFSPTLKQLILSKPVLVTLIQTIIVNDGNISEPMSPRPYKMKIEVEKFEKVMSKLIYGSDNPVEYSEYSVAFEFFTENETGEKLPPMWTPTNQLSKAAAIEQFFPQKVENLGYMPEQLPPPQIIVIYDGTKAAELLDLITEFKEYVLKVGYFDNIDGKIAKLICKKYQDLKNFQDDQIKNIKIVIALKKDETDDILLEFSQIIPLYISADEKIGIEESELFFPYDYVNEECTQEEQETVEFDQEEYTISVTETPERSDKNNFRQ